MSFSRTRLLLKQINLPLQKNKKKQKNKQTNTKTQKKLRQK